MMSEAEPAPRRQAQNIRLSGRKINAGILRTLAGPGFQMQVGPDRAFRIQFLTKINPSFDLYHSRALYTGRIFTLPILNT